MTNDRKKFFLATAALIGTTIGVGIFAVPYAISSVGAVPAALLFLVLGGIQILQHLFYAEAAMATPEKLRLPGLVEKYLGKKAKHVSAVSTVLGFWCGQIAYIIVGGTFLHSLVSPFLGGAPFYYQVAGVLAGSVIVYFGIGFVSKIDFWTTLGVIAAMLGIIVTGIVRVRPDYLVPFNGGDVLLPYGVILFALSGLAAIPEMEDILEGKHEHYRKAIVSGSLVAAALTAAFGFVVWGVTGPATTEDAVTGLRLVLGSGITTLTAAFGLLAVTTAYMMSSTNLRSTFMYDYKLGKVTSWLLAIGVPIIVFLFGAQSFISIIGFSGAVFGGVTAVSVALLYIAVAKKKLVRDNPLGVPLWTAYVSIVILALGAGYEIVTSASRLLQP